MKELGVHKGKTNPAYGKHWFNNGTEELLATDCPEGFKPGRLPK